MRIVFVLPARTPSPVGGFKVVYEYAGRLADRGHSVAVVHPWDCDRPASPLDRLRARRWAASLARHPERIAPWFDLDSRVEALAAPWLEDRWIPAADALVATAWQTAGAVAAIAPPGGGFYLIQHFEDWDDPAAVVATWRLPLRKIVIAGWLQDKAVELGEGERTVKVANGLDGESFGVDVAIPDRAPRVGALISPLKGEADVVAALRAARERVPELSAVGYGIRPRTAELPEWMDYEQLPSPAALRALYNGCSIFLQASHSEGWGLPATESMLCGCALVTYDNGGSREYATDGETALVVDLADGDTGLAAAIVHLCEDGELRRRLAAAGRERAAGFTWERATDGLERVLLGGSADG